MNDPKAGFLQAAILSLLVLIDLFLIRQAVKWAASRLGYKTTEALGMRRKEKKVYSRCLSFVRESVRKYDKRDKRAGIYEKAVAKMRRSGYSGDYAPAAYLLAGILVPALVFIAALFMNYPDVLPGMAAAAGIYAAVEIIAASGRKKMSLKLQKYMYKIYKYLHNQISSGVRVPDAIRTVHEVIDDKKLKAILIRLAAFYELTLDIDAALEEFGRNFTAHEADTLCIVLKQGIETGDNQELLARQEDVMFKKYFNYIQAETDSCKTRSLIAAAMFTAVVVLMIVIPLVNDASDAVGRIFIN